MKYKKENGDNWVIRLERGEELVSSLTKLINDHDIKSCWISGLGAFSSATLGFYDLEKKEYNWKIFDEDVEITSLQGNISWMDDEIILHIHGSFSKSDMSAIGGHVKELVVAGTCEIYLKTLKMEKLTRSKDSEIGLSLLDL